MCLIWLYSRAFFLELRLGKYVYYMYVKEWINDVHKLRFINVTDEPPS